MGEHRSKAPPVYGRYDLDHRAMAERLQPSVMIHSVGWLKAETHRKDWRRCSAPWFGKISISSGRHLATLIDTLIDTLVELRRHGSRLVVRDHADDGTTVGTGGLSGRPTCW
jgi:hypothetical protein